MIAHVVQSTSTYVSACSFQLVRSLLHLCPVAFIQALCNLGHAHCEWHHLQTFEHCNKKGLLSTKVLNRCDYINWIGHVEVNNTNDHIVGCSLVLRHLYSCFSRI